MYKSVILTIVKYDKVDVFLQNLQKIVKSNQKQIYKYKKSIRRIKNKTISFLYNSVSCYNFCLFFCLL